MTAAIAHKLLAIFLTVGLGWAAGRLGWFAARAEGIGRDPAQALAQACRVLSDAAFMLFVPALLLRTMARLDLATLPWSTLGAFFAPAVVFVVAVYAARRRGQARAAAAGQARSGAAHPAAPAAWAVSASYGNAVQLGIPIATALFGPAGLALHVALVSLHGVVLLTLLTALAELDLARADRHATRLSTARALLRNAVVHPVTLPVLLGLGWNLTGLGLHPVVDDALALLGSAAVPVCLVLIGMNLALYGLRGRVRTALGLSVLKLLVLPAAVLAFAHAVLGLTGMPLAVVVLMAALPVGSNALIFAERYGTLQAEATAGIVVSTLGFVATAALWLAVLSALGALEAPGALGALGALDPAGAG